VKTDYMNIEDVHDLCAADSPPLLMDELSYFEIVEYMNTSYGDKWSLAYTPWGDRIICHLTVNGITRSGVSGSDRGAFREAVVLFRDLRKHLEDFETLGEEF
jgi:hypothetical protein